MRNRRQSGLLAGRRAIANTAIGNVKSGCRIRREARWKIYSVARGNNRTERRPDAGRAATAGTGLSWALIALPGFFSEVSELTVHTTHSTQRAQSY